MREKYDINKNELGEEHEDALNLKINIAEILRLQDKYNDAQDIYNYVLSIRTTKFGEKHIDTIEVQKNIASVLQEKKDFYRDLASTGSGRRGRLRSGGSPVDLCFDKSATGPGLGSSSYRSSDWR